MLQAMRDAMIESLKRLKATEEVIGAYNKFWDDTLEGRTRYFPCPACFMSDRKNSALKAQPAKAGIHYVACPVCDTTYSYQEEGDF